MKFRIKNKKLYWVEDISLQLGSLTSLLPLVFIGSIGALFELFTISISAPIFLSVYNKDHQINVKDVLEKYLDPMIPELSRFFETDFEVKILICFLGIYILRTVLSYITQLLLTIYANNQRYRLSSELYNQILDMNFSQFKLSNRGALLNTLSTEVNFYATHIVHPILTIAVECAVLFSILLLLLINFPFPSTIAIAYLIIIIFLYLSLASPRLKAHGKNRSEYEDKRVSRVLDTFNLFEELLVHKRQDILSVSYKEIARRVSDSLNGLAKFQLAPRYVIELSTIIGLISGVLWAIKNDNQETFVAMIVTVGFALFRILPSLTKINMSVVNWKYGLASIPNLKKLIADKQAVDEIFAKEIRIDRENTSSYIIEIREGNLSFNEKKILNEINLGIRGGEWVAILGKTGVGKSTLIRTIMGLYELDSGSLMVKKSSNTNAPSFSLLPQEPSLLNGDVIDNVTLYQDAVDPDRLEWALELAQCNEFLIGRDKTTLDTLSGGQKQRLCLARCIYNGTDIIVMDEPTSALDGVTGIKVLKELKNKLRNVTVIIITHDQRLLEFCDSVVTVSDSGTLES